MNQNATGGDDILTATFEQTARIHVAVNLTTGEVLDNGIEREQLGPHWELAAVRDENGLRATTEEAARAGAIAEPALLDTVGDGNPNYPGGIGCEYCDTLWATSESLTEHEKRIHPEKLPKPTARLVEVPDDYNVKLGYDDRNYYS